ncbi:MarR family transcriptional regulator [Shewanella sp. Scap07]|uniref:MarR family winged helix-turn-helix transcriptional regulator n=1 Tax=Shewanella sp. Scap07 TaxID=2589987 RepID=UPI0015C060BB|nr:MarR family transcriptional regulator [Shewanella sp. Scap07]QLE84033.1 MarR family transcriptional regulator [Shewanella sp. Scap07]
MSDNQSLEGLLQLVHGLKRNLHEQIEQLQLDIAPMHVRVLKIISRKPQCTAVDIAGYLNRDKAQVTRLLSTLITQNLIEKHANPQDKRSQYLQLTAAGQAIMDQVTGLDANIYRKMTQDISAKELQDFEQIAQKMNSNLSS